VKALFLTNEYPPKVYGGAGVHVDYLSRELAKTMPVEVRCFGDQKREEGNLSVLGFELDDSGFTCPTPPISMPISCIAIRGTAISAGSWRK
jgi:hypothetical protein